MSGLRPAVITLLMLASIGVMGVWDEAMDTASQVLVATAIAVFFGILIGVWAAESPRVERLLRPLLDTLQTLPQLVYIIPFIYLMPVSRIPGVVASVLYAIPVVIRLVTSGVRSVSPTAVEAASAFGASRMQVLLKVKIPLARDSIMLGVNQGIIMVLAVVVIGGLVGSGALGDMVARGLQRNEFGEGVVASLAILALGIALDRVTQGRAKGSTTMRRASMGKRSRWSLALVLALLVALFAAACGDVEGRLVQRQRERQRRHGKDCGTVTLNEQAWAGSTANTYIAKAVLEDKLGCKVEITKIAEIPVYQAMADGKTDAVLEDWQHTDEYAKYIDKAGTVVMGGPLGVEGHIGWFIPKYLMDAASRVRDLGGPEGQGGPVQDGRVGRPGHVPRRRPQLRPEGQGADRGARAQLQARHRGRRAGAGGALEPALQAEEAGDLLLVHAAVPQPGVRPRPRSSSPRAHKDCKDDAKEGGDPAQYKCAYDVTIINKLFSKKFADSGSPAYPVLKKMKLTNEDQEKVAKAIAGDKEDPDQAGKDWVSRQPGQGQQPGFSKPALRLRGARVADQAPALLVPELQAQRADAAARA